MVKNFPTKKTPCLNSFTDKFYQIHKKEIILILHKLFSKIEEEGLFTNWFHVANTPTLSPKSGKHITRRRKKKTIDEYTSYYINMNTKIINKILLYRIKQYIKRIMHPDQVMFTLGI